MIPPFMLPTFSTPSDAWYSAVDGLLQLDPAHYGVSPRGQATVEYAGPQTFAVERPLAIRLQAGGRAFRHVIGVVEGLSLVGQVSVPEVIIDKVSAFRPFMTRSIFWGAYGPRVAGDIGNVVELLKGDPDSRQAVLTIFDADRDLMRTEQADLPCTVALMYQVRRGSLEAWTVMRSNDAWLGLPYDLMQFGMLQAAVAQALGLPAGAQTHSANSLHLYERSRAKAMLAGPAPRSGAPQGFDGPLWGADDIGEISSRARRILLGQASRLDGLTDFEAWAADLLS